MRPFNNWPHKVLFLIIITCIFQITGRRTKGPKWWRIGKVTDPTNLISNEILSNSLIDNHLPEVVHKLLKKKQKRLLRENQGSLPFIVQAIEMALEECQSQMVNRRWNCTTLPTRKPSPFGKMVSVSCRETAFIYAMASAAVLHAVTRGCTEGSIQSCSCEYNPQRNSVVDPYRSYPAVNPSNMMKPLKAQSWHWGGCSENVRFGAKFTRSFVDSSEKGWNMRSLMNLHNGHVGRMHVTNYMMSECKCHGMSGSCAVKTCWRRLPKFKKVGEMLRIKFDDATMVAPTKDLISMKNDRRRYRRKKLRKWKRARIAFQSENTMSPSTNDLIYLDESPNFCPRNKKLSIPGTKGRECNATSRGFDSCEVLCCGRGFRSEIVEVRSRCSCTFKWCCEVKCKICYKRMFIHTCR